MIKIQYYDDSIPFGAGEISFRTYMCPDKECLFAAHSRNHANAYRNVEKHIYMDHVEPFLIGLIGEDDFFVKVLVQNGSA